MSVSHTNWRTARSSTSRNRVPRAWAWPPSPGQALFSSRTSNHEPRGKFPHFLLPALLPTSSATFPLHFVHRPFSPRFPVSPLFAPIKVHPINSFYRHFFPCGFGVHPRIFPCPPIPPPHSAPPPQSIFVRFTFPSQSAPPSRLHRSTAPSHGPRHASSATSSPDFSPE